MLSQTYNIVFFHVVDEYSGQTVYDAVNYCRHNSHWKTDRCKFENCKINLGYLMYHKTIPGFN